MTTRISRQGGARVGFLTATWPLARLTADDRRLRLSVFPLGAFEFPRGAALSITPVEGLMSLGTGVRLRHNRGDFPERLEFYGFRRAALLRDLAALGYGKADGQAPATPNPGRRYAGFPFRIAPLVGVLVLWNVLMLAAWGGLPHGPLGDLPADRPLVGGPFLSLALAMVFGLAVGITRVPALARLFLKPGAGLGDYRAMLQLVAVIAGTLFVLTALFPPF